MGIAGLSLKGVPANKRAAATELAQDIASLRAKAGRTRDAAAKRRLIQKAGRLGKRLTGMGATLRGGAAKTKTVAQAAGAGGG